MYFTIPTLKFQVWSQVLTRLGVLSLMKDKIAEFQRRPGDVFLGTLDCDMPPTKVCNSGLALNGATSEFSSHSFSKTYNFVSILQRTLQRNALNLLKSLP